MPEKSGTGSADEPEEPVNVEVVAHNVPGWYPSHLPFPHLMDRFITLYRAPRRPECPEALLGDDTLLHKPVILLHDVIEVLHRPVPATARQVSRALEAGDRCRVGGSEIGVDDAWCTSAVPDRTAKQALGGLFVAER